MKGNASCHIPSDSYRGNYDSIFRPAEETDGLPPTAISFPECGDLNTVSNQTVGDNYE